MPHPRARGAQELPGLAGQFRCLLWWSVALAEHIRQFPPADNGLLFHTLDGLPLHHDWYQNKTFVPAALKAGCPKGTTSHALRQCVVGCGGVRHRGDDAERLGHDNANLVLSTYGHLLPNMEDRTCRVVDAALETHPVAAATSQGRPE